MTPFTKTTPTLDTYWRAIVLFGRNVASYKFALAASLLEFRGRDNDLVPLDELARPFARHLCRHLAHSPKQATSRSSRFLDTCRQFNDGRISEAQLLKTTRRIGFTNVIDAFHVVNQGEIEPRFFLDERATHGGIRLTDSLFEIHEDAQSPTLELEVEARWRLVETAWGLGMSRHLVALQADPKEGTIFTALGGRRTDVTSARDALNGYQKGRCFHCRTPIGISDDDAALADVDHFFPHLLKPRLPVDGIWNLVLSCRDCNRGHDGKFARVPSTLLLSRLHRRNEYLIASHHPLRETLMAQTGGTAAVRRAFLQAAHDTAVAALIHVWEPQARWSTAF